MRVKVIFSLMPESRHELIDSYPSSYLEFRESMERVQADSGFGQPDKVELHWIVNSGRWDAGTDTQGAENGKT